MVISDTHRYIYIAIPKTGSLSMMEILQYYGGNRIGEYHSWDVPEELRDYFTFTIVRNPYERCFSFWAYEQSICLGSRQNGRTFRQYMQWMIDHKDTPDPFLDVPMMRMTQTQYFERSGCDVFLKLEDRDLSKLPFLPDEVFFPHLRKTPDKPDRPRWEQEDLDLIHEYCAEDFATFGYDLI